MELILAYVGAARVSAKEDFAALTASYLERCSAFLPSRAESFRTQTDLLAWLDRRPGRVPPVPVLFDSRGRQMTSESFASWIGERRDEGIRELVFAIGPPDGWSDEARRRARLLLSLGPFTMAHTLARLVLAEQLYRACTILAGHPYHSGH